MQDLIPYILLLLLCIIIYLLIRKKKDNVNNKNEEELNRLKDSLTSSINTMSVSFNSFDLSV